MFAQNKRLKDQEVIVIPQSQGDLTKHQNLFTKMQPVPSEPIQLNEKRLQENKYAFDIMDN